MAESLEFPSIAAVDAHFPSHPKPTTLPVPNSTRSFWLNSSPTCNPYAKHGADKPLPPASETADVLIIGTGISGIFTLYHLVQGLKRSNRQVTSIVLLEARDFCSGATGRNGGHCTAYNPMSFATLKKNEGLDDAVAHVNLERRAVETVIDLVESSGWAEDVDLTKDGNIHLVTSDKVRDTLKYELDEARAAGINLDGFEWLSEEACSKLIGSKDHVSGVKIPGNNLYPLKLVNKLYALAASEAASAGIDVALYTNTPVDSVSSAFTSSGDQAWVAKTPRGQVKSRRVVHATNAYASHLLPQLVEGDHVVVPCRGQVMAFRPKNDDKFWKTGFSYNEGFEYFFQRPSKLSNTHAANDAADKSKIPYIILGGGRSIAPLPYELDVSDDSTFQPQVTAYLEKFLPNHFPSLFGDTSNNQQIDFSWSGIMGFTKTRNPFIGYVFDSAGKKMDGQYMLVGYSGHGMSRAPACAEVVAGMVLADIEGKPQPKLDWVPSHFYSRP